MVVVGGISQMVVLPPKRAIKPIYIKHFVELIDKVKE